MSLIPSQRHLFSVPDDVSYFNCAYYSPQLKEAERRLIAGVQRKARPWQVTPPDFFTDAETIRTLSSKLFGGDRDGYAILPAASYGVSTAARAVEPHLKTGDRILVIAEEFPSNVLPWRRTAQETGAAIVTVPSPSNGDWTSAILESVTRGVKVVAMSTCHWTNGARIDLDPIGVACRDVGATLVVDTTQTLGAMPFDVAKIQPDFLIGAGYKWLLGPYGFAILYVSEKWRSARPLEESWLSRDNAEDFTSLARYSDDYMPGARRFDVGEKCAATILPGVIAAMEQIEAWGIANIAETLAAINARIGAHLQGLGCELPPAERRCPHMFGARLPASYKGSLVADLRQRNIFISQRGDSLRFAPHLYVNEDDVSRLLVSLTDLMK